MIQSELWMDIDGFEGFYQVSSEGRVKSFQQNTITGRLLKPKTDKDGYKEVCLHKDGHQYMRKVHRLVGIAFIDNPNNLPMINHIDEDKSNNNIDNLEWVTPKENCNHGTAIERMISTKGSRPFRCIETGKIYTNQHEFAREVNSSQQAVYHVLKGDYKTTMGFHLEYV